MADIDDLSCPLPLTDHDTIQLAHGAGGRLSGELIARHLLPRFGNPQLDRLEDQAILEVPAGRLAFSTDTFVVSPLEFPGGDIGELAVNGTVNDLAMGGARPLYLSVGLILEEGLPLATLERILDSMAAAARRAGVRIVTGDTKVVDRGHGDGMFINTSGIGVVPDGVVLGADRIRPGDAVLVSGTIADHGMAIMATREELSFRATIASDTAPLHDLAAALLDACPDGRLRTMRDPTRGGLATTLNEFAAAAGVGIVLEEGSIPVRDDVQAACEILGFDPLAVANEGKLVAVVAADAADAALAALRSHPLGRDAAIVGAVTADHAGMVTLRTALGVERIVDMPLGLQLPRIC
jgi:hydrogenase expression/formation protein HypE